MSFELPKIAKKDTDITYSYRLHLELRDINASFGFRTVKDAVQYLEAKCKGKRAGDVGIHYRDYETNTDKSLSVPVKEYKKVIEVLEKYGKDLTPNLWSYAVSFKYCPDCRNFCTCYHGTCEVCGKSLEDPRNLIHEKVG